MSPVKDKRGDATWTDPERPPTTIGHDLTKHGDGVWSVRLGDEPNPHIWHWCTHRPPSQADREPRWQLGSTGAHGLVRRDPLTLSPSLLLSDCCGLHGFITDGVWISV